MITAREALFRARKGRRPLANVYRGVRRKHGMAAVHRLWRDVKASLQRAHEPGGHAYVGHKRRIVGLQALLEDRR